MIDSHSHIYLEEFDNDRKEAMARAMNAGIRHLVLPNVDTETIERMLSLHAEYPHYTSIALGLHPTSVADTYRTDLEQIHSEFARNKVVAVGEIGIDLYWDVSFREQQMEVFDTQLHWAEEMGLPVIIHCRKALAEVLSTMENYSGTLPRCVFHSFDGTAEDIRAIRQHGDFYFGINGIVTFKNSKLRSVLPTIGIDRILLETDCPYLTPTPHRGKRNESSYIPYIATAIADTLGVSIGTVSRTTDCNASEFFGIDL